MVQKTLIETTLSLSNIEIIAKEISSILEEKDTVALYGTLGAGKTTLIKHILSFRGFDPDDISSPSFTIMNIYENNNGNKAIHFDFYRLKNKEEFYYMDYDKYVDEYLSFIEWAEKIEEYLPKNTLKIELNLLNEKRYIKVYRDE